MAKEKELPADPLIDYSKEGVPVSRNMEDEATPTDASEKASAQSRKRQGTEDAQKRSDTGTGL